MTQDEYFGTDDQRAVLRRGQSMAVLLEGDARFGYYGRTVGLVSPQDGGIEDLAALARIQGNSNSATVPENATATLKAQLEARGLIPTHYAKWEGTDAVLSAARDVIATVALPDDITVHRMDGATSREHMDSFAAMALGCGVLPLCGAAMRGLLRPSVCLFALDSRNTVVTCAATSAFARKDHPVWADQAWWGMLATDPSRRGQRLALILGAMAIRDMAADFGFRNFMTGVVPGNAPSEAVCARMGLARGESAIIGCADPHALTSGRMTK